MFYRHFSDFHWNVFFGGTFGLCFSIDNRKYVGALVYDLLDALAIGGVSLSNSNV